MCREATSTPLTDGRLCYRADIAVLAFSGGRVVRRENAGDGSDDGAHSLAKRLVLGLLDSVLQRRASSSVVDVLRSSAGDAGMLVQALVMVGGRAYNGASLTRSVQINIRVRRGKDGVGSSHDGADLCVCSHDDAL